MRTMLSITCGLVMATGAFAQVNETEMKERSMADAKARTAQLTQDLGLTEEQAEKALAIMTNMEMSTLPERIQCRSIEMKVESANNAAYDEVAGMLSPEQADKLAHMRKEGTISTKCCAPTPNKAACAPVNAGKSGCCSGKASSGQPADAPHPTMDKAGSEEKKVR